MVRVPIVSIGFPAVALASTLPSPAVLGVFLVHLFEQTFFKGLRNGLQMHVVAIASPLAGVFDELLALGI